MTVRRSNRAVFPALNDYHTLERLVLPDVPAGFVTDHIPFPSNFFSDHVALFVRLGWINPSSAKASRISDLPDGAVVGDGTAGRWVIAGGAKFGIPNEDIYDRLYQSRLDATLPPPALGVVGDVPLDGTLLRQENGALSVIVGGAKFRVPDHTTLARLYPGAAAVRLWDAALASIPNVPLNGALIRDDDGKLWLIAGGAKFQVPDQAVRNRLYSEVRPFPLWNGALANIGRVPALGTPLREESSQTVFVMRRGGLVPATALYLFEDVVVLWDGAFQSIPR